MTDPNTTLALACARITDKKLILVGGCLDELVSALEILSLFNTAGRISDMAKDLAVAKEKNDVVLAYLLEVQR